MKEFEKWQKIRSVKTIGFLDGNSAYRAGEREGWKASLEWILNYINTNDVAISRDWHNIDVISIKKLIEEELEQ